MPPPVPPMVKLGRSTHGRPTSSRMSQRLGERVGDAATSGTSTPILIIASLNFCRSSALSMTSALAPIISTPYFSRTPCLCRSIAVFSAGLPAEGGQEGVGPLLGDDLLDDLPGDRLDVGAVGRLRVGHDGGRVGVHQDDRVALLAERLARLGAGVVELAGLADDDGAGADEQDLLDVGALRHGSRGSQGSAATGGSVQTPNSLRPAGGPHQGPRETVRGSASREAPRAGQPR